MLAERETPYLNLDEGYISIQIGSLNRYSMQNDPTEFVRFPVLEVYEQQPIINGREFPIRSQRQRLLAKLLTLLPPKTGILQDSAYKTIYPTATTDSAEDRLRYDILELNVALSGEGLKIFNPIQHGGDNAIKSIPRYGFVRDNEIDDNYRINLGYINIMNRAVQKDTEAFAALFDMHRNQVYRFILYKTNNPELADDLMDEAFLKAWESIERYQVTEKPFSHFLMKISRNLVVDYWRANKKHLGNLDDCFDLTDNKTTTADIVANGLDIEALTLALGNLPDNYREVIILRFIEGYSHEETANNYR